MNNIAGVWRLQVPGGYNGYTVAPATTTLRDRGGGGAAAADSGKQKQLQLSSHHDGSSIGSEVATTQQSSLR